MYIRRKSKIATPSHPILRYTSTRPVDEGTATRAPGWRVTKIRREGKRKTFIVFVRSSAL